MNSEQITGGLRLIVGYALAFAAGKGWISSNDIVQLTPLAVAAILFAYGIYKKRDKGLLDTAKQVPGVVGIDVNTAAASPAVVAAAISLKPEDAKIKPV